MYGLANTGGAGEERGTQVKTSLHGDLPPRAVVGSAGGDPNLLQVPTFDRLLRPGTRLANSRGVPGRLGALAISRHDQALVVLTCQHVLVGAGGQPGDPVWLTADLDGAPQFVLVGRSGYGRIGTVERSDSPVHVDCAVVTVDGWSGPPAGWSLVPDAEPAAGPLGLLRPGHSVWVDAGASGPSHGVVTDGGNWDGHAAKPGQLLIRSLEPQRPFSAEGDSGALVRDDAGAPVGLLWGTTPGGASIATPINAVIDILGLQLVRLVPADAGAFAGATR